MELIFDIAMMITVTFYTLYRHVIGGQGQRRGT